MPLKKGALQFTQRLKCKVSASDFVLYYYFVLYGLLVSLMLSSFLLDSGDLVSRVSGDAVDPMFAHLIIPSPSRDAYFKTKSFVIVPVPLPQPAVYNSDLSTSQSPQPTPHLPPLSCMWEQHS